MTWRGTKEKGYKNFGKPRMKKRYVYITLNNKEYDLGEITLREQYVKCLQERNLHGYHLGTGFEFNLWFKKDCEYVVLKSDTEVYSTHAGRKDKSNRSLVTIKDKNYILVKGEFRYGTGYRKLFKPVLFKIWVGKEPYSKRLASSSSSNPTITLDNYIDLCPMYKKCKAVSGIDCRRRDYTQCDFFKMCVLHKLIELKRVPFTLKTRNDQPNNPGYIYHPWLWHKTRMSWRKVLEREYNKYLKEKLGLNRGFIKITED